MSGAVSQDAARGAHNVDKLVRDYLSALGDHLMYILRQKLGDGIINNTPLEFVVTVPAIWSDLAKDKTRKACQEAAGLSATKAPIHLSTYFGNPFPSFLKMSRGQDMPQECFMP